MPDTETQGETARPSFEEVFANDNASESPTEATSSEASSAEPSAAAPTSQPTPPQTDESTRDARGPLPYDRHQAILTRERNEHQRILQEERARWADYQPYVDSGLNPEVLRYLVDMGQKYAGDKRGFMEAMSGDPEVQKWIAEKASSASFAKVQDAEPQPDLQAPDGTLVYSAPQLRAWGEWRDRQSESRLERTLKPLLNEREARIAREESEAEIKQAEGQATKVLSGYIDLPYFRENMPAIRAKYDDLRRQGNADLGLAYSLVLKETVLPNLSATERANVSADMKRQAHAASINPKAAAPSQSARPADFFDPSLDWGPMKR